MWSKIGTDLFESKGIMVYLDYHLKWIEVDKLDN